MRKLAFILFILIAPTIANAEKSVQRETVERLLEVMHAEQIITTMYSQIDQMFAGIAKNLGVKESEQEIFNKFMSKVVAAMKKEMTWQKMKDPMIDIYIKHYTETEINDLLAFYSSKSGKSILKKMPAVMQDSMLISQSMLREFIPKIRTISEELNKELQMTRNAKTLEKPADNKEQQ